jgi:hypothetical protein
MLDNEREKTEAEILEFMRRFKFDRETAEIAPLILLDILPETPVPLTEEELNVVREIANKLGA